MKYSQEKAVSMLLKNGINKLPLHYNDIEKMIFYEGYNVIAYGATKPEAMELLKRLDLESTAKNSNCFVYQKDDIKYLFYNNKLSEQQKTHLFAHELGHIVLGHVEDRGKLTEQDYGLAKDSQEQEANEFAVEFLAPTSVLKEAGIYTQPEIMTCTGLSYEDAFIACGKVNSDNDFFMESDALCSQFSEYIYNYRNRKKKGKGVIEKIVFVIAVILVMSLIMMATNPYRTLHTDSNASPTSQANAAIVDEQK